MEAIKGIFSKHPSSNQEKPERALADPRMVQLVEQGRGYSIAEEALGAIVDFALHRKVRKPTLFTTKKSKLAFLVTLIAKGVCYVQTRRRIGGGTFKEAFEAYKLTIAQGLIEKRCERTVRNSEKHPHNIRDALAENEFAANFHHPNVMGESELALLHKRKKGGDELSLFDPLMDGDGTAFKDDPDLTTDERIKFVADVGSGLLYLHSLGIVHRDLKLPNILFQRIEGTVVAKISDFGTATYAADIKIGSWAGTLTYLPSAVQRGIELQGPKSGSYSFGIVAGVLLRPLGSEDCRVW